MIGGLCAREVCCGDVAAVDGVDALHAMEGCQLVERLEEAVEHVEEHRGAECATEGRIFDDVGKENGDVFFGYLNCRSTADHCLSYVVWEVRDDGEFGVRSSQFSNWSATPQGR